MQICNIYIYTSLHSYYAQSLRTCLHMYLDHIYILQYVVYGVLVKLSLCLQYTGIGGKTRLRGGGGDELVCGIDCDPGWLAAHLMRSCWRSTSCHHFYAMLLLCIMRLCKAYLHTPLRGTTRNDARAESDRVQRWEMKDECASIYIYASISAVHIYICTRYIYTCAVFRDVYLPACDDA